MEEKKGYHFEGWYIDKEFTKRLNPGGILPHELTLYDKWIPIWYPITYVMNGGTNSRKNPKYISVESGVVLLHQPKKKDQIFEGWYLNDEKIDFIPEGQTGPITLVAKYRDLFTISFETYGGGILPNIQTNSNKKINDIRVPRKLGYVFSGWYWDEEYTKPYDLEQSIDHNCTLYAKWEIEYFIIKYDADGGISSRKNPRVYTYFDKTVSLLPARKQGYEFIGWFDLRGNPLNEIREHSIGNKELVAHYRKMD